MLFRRKAGKFTVEEFNVAVEEFRLKNAPKIYTYMKELSAGESPTPELAHFKTHLSDELGLFWTNYLHIDTMHLHFVLQLQISEPQLDIKMELREQKVVLEDEVIADLNKLPFASMNKEFRHLKETIAELDEDIAGLRKDLAADAGNERLSERLLRKSSKRNQLSEQFEQHQRFLFDLAVSFAKIPGERCSARMRKARELFEQGKASEANAVLDSEEIERDAVANLKEWERGEKLQQQRRENLGLNVQEFILKAQTVMTDDKFPLPDRFAQACAAYDRALELAGKIDYESENLAELFFEYAFVCQQFNKFEKSVRLYEEALTIQRKLVDIDSSLFLPYVATTLNNLGILHRAMNRNREAEQEYNEALKIYRELSFSNPSVYQSAVATILNNLGNLHRAMNRNKEAEQAYNEALKIYRELSVSNPSGYRSAVATILNNLGILHSAMNRNREAEQKYSEALAIRRELSVSNPSVYQPDVATSLNNLGNLHRAMNRNREAEQEYSEALKFYRELTDSNPLVYQPYVATILNNLGTLYSDINRNREAEQAYREALAIRRDLSVSNPLVYRSDVATTLNNLGNLHSDMNRNREAEQEYNEALAIRRELSISNPLVYQPDVAATLNNLGNLHRAMNWNREAEQAYSEALAIRRELCVFNPLVYQPDVAMTLFNYGLLLEFGTEEYTKAIDFYKEAYEIYSEFASCRPDYAELAEQAKVRIQEVMDKLNKLNQ